MSDKLMQAADAVKSVARAYRAVILVADELERIGSIEQAANEAQVRLDATVKAEGEVKVALEKTRELLARVQSDLTSATETADALKADAAVKAQEVTKTILADAWTRAASVTAAAQKEADDVDAKTRAAQLTLDQLNQAITEAKTTHTDVTAQIGALRRTLGGV